MRVSAKTSAQWHRHILWLAGAALALSGFVAHASDDLFEKRVRPILADRCFSCHGPEKQKSDLRLDSAAAMAKGGSQGPAFQADDPASSRILDAIAYDSEPKMPPDGRLSQDDIDTLTEWVMAGAVWPDYPDAPAPQSGGEAPHWSYQPLQPVAVPEIADAQWPRNDVDRFILARIEAAGAQPSAAADKRTLIRRATFDLTGLPPTPEDVNAFLADDAPDAFTRVVDRLLASPQYGQQWARHWLDLVRYTDSFDSRGSAQTDPAEIWRYRDWVVGAFNSDMPYDRFVEYQIAGDLAPTGDGSFNREGLIATGMLAIGNWPQGDADKEKMVTDIVDDQIDVVMRGVLSTTFTCARCHDHKFEPFTTADYYGMAGIFFSSSILPGPGAKTEGSPILHLPLASPEELAARKAREERIAALNAERETLAAEERAAWASAESARTGDYLLAAWQRYAAGDANAGQDCNAEALAAWGRALGIGGFKTLDGLSKDIQGMPGLHTRTGTGGMPSATVNTNAMEVKFSTITLPANAFAVHPASDRPVNLAWRSPVTDTVSIVGRVADADGNCGNGIHWIITRINQAVRTIIAEGDMANAGEAPIVVEQPVAVSTGDMFVLTIAPRDDYSCDSTVVEWTMTSAGGDVWDLTTDVLPIFTEGDPWPDAYGHQAVWYAMDDVGPVSVDPALLTPWWAAIASSGSILLEDAASAIQAEAANYAPSLTSPTSPFWLASPPSMEGTRRAAIDAELASLEAAVPPPLDLAVGIQEGGVPTTPYEGFQDVAIHKRGDYNNLGDIVPRRFPVILAGGEQPAIGEGSGRAALAKWVASDTNPLTARVMVNRIWQHHFGEAIVRTPGDFGVRGEAPTHPELLDYLANEFIASGWSVKAIHREIMLSAAYQQSSEPSPELLAADPENRLFARMNRVRLTAEPLRDAMLAVSGKLDLSAGGPAYTDLNTPRRTLYFKTVRSDRTTYTMLFDGADPTAIIPKRTEATVAPQALFLMNHPFVIAQADTLARRIESETTDRTEQIGRLHELLYARSATDRDREHAVALLDALHYPEPHALAAYCQVLLTANEFAFID